MENALPSFVPEQSNGSSTKKPESPLTFEKPIFSSAREKFHDHLFSIDEHQPTSVRREYTNTCKEVYDILMNMDLSKKHTQCGGVIVFEKDKEYINLQEKMSRKCWDALMMFNFFQMIILDRGDGSIYIAPQNGDNIQFLFRSKEPVIIH